MDRITEDGLDFKDFEQWCYDMGMAFARMLMSLVLHSLDEKILKERDKSIYRAKDKRPVTLKTLMGEVEINRRLYKKMSGEDSGYVYLLDQAIGLGLGKIGKITVNLIRRIAETITESSYRATSGAVNFMTGQELSHMGVWNVVQAVGAKVKEKDDNLAKLAKAFPDRGEKVVRVLQEEFDGVWVNMQGKDRPEKGKKVEMKLSLAYEGVKLTGKDKKGKPKYAMVNPLFMAGFESADKFYEKKEGQIGSIYNLDEIEVRLMNGDGNGWVQGMADRCGSEAYLQLDPFHVKREIKRGLPKEEQAPVSKMLEKRETDEALEYIGSLVAGISDPEAKKKPGKLLTYLKNNKDHLIPIKERGLKLPSPPEGIEYGSMGAMEGTVCNVAALRMKKRKASFTKEGAVNLARLICFKRGGGLDEAICGINEARLPMIIEEVITTVLSAAKAPKKDGKGYLFPTIGGIPFKDTFMTNGRRAVKGLTDYRALSELAFK
jgi:hypothetical protein